VWNYKLSNKILHFGVCWWVLCSYAANWHYCVQDCKNYVALCQMQRMRLWILTTNRFLCLGLLLTVYFLSTGVGGLRDVAVTVPIAVTPGDTVTLQCSYDLEGDPLYTVKWYKGRQEFFRYVPKELPHTRVFPLPGVNVDVSTNTGLFKKKVTLSHVYNEVTSGPTTTRYKQLLGKLSKFVCN
jgi:hypothetical protein